MWSLLDTGWTWVLRPRRRKAPEKMMRSWSLWKAQQAREAVGRGQAGQARAALGPGAQVGDQLGQLLAQLHQPGAFAQLALHVAVAPLAEGVEIGVAGGEVQGRAGEQVALDEARAAFQGEVQFRLGLHAFGDDPAAGLLGHLRQGLDHLAAGAAAGGLLEQAHVQLEDVRLQRQHAVELGVAGAEIVDGDARAGVAVARHHLGQALVAAAQLGDLEDHPVRVDAVLLQLLEAGQRLVGAQPADPAWRDVQAEEPVRRRFRQARQGVVADLPVEAAQGGRGNLRIDEQRAHREQLAVGLAHAAEGFDPGDEAGGGIDEGLEAGDRLPVDQGTHP
jgi:hypothetical protein